MVFVCDICGYEYNPDVGDPDIGIEAGTAFADVPDDFRCPLCGAVKNMFKAL